MASEVTGVEVALPGREARAQASYPGAKKPMARVTFELSGGGERGIVVPVRVGRILKQQEFGLPRELDEVLDVIHDLEGRVCFTVLTEMISRREYAVQEARQKLALYGYRPQDIDAAVQRALDQRFLDDVRFASNFVETRVARGWGQRKIELELKRAGVDPAIVEGYPEAFFSEEADAARARELLARRRIPEANAYEKFVRHLMAKGFSYRVASEAARERIAEAEAAEG